jgi:hypothetical protein
MCRSVNSALRPRLSYSNVIATLALFVALGGAAIAAGLPRHSVGARQLKRGAVASIALRRGAVTRSKLARGSVVATKLAPNSVWPQAIGDGAVTAGKLAMNAVTGTAIAGSAIGTGKLGSNVVTTSKIANGAVTSAKLGNEVAPLLGTLKSGQTLRGVFDLGTEAKDGTDFVSGGISFSFPLASAPTMNPVLAADSSSANCPGVTGSNQQTPNASPGNLCVYVSAQTGEAGSLETENPSRFGFGLRANAKAPGAYETIGVWAVTAP